MRRRRSFWSNWDGGPGPSLAGLGSGQSCAAPSCANGMLCSPLVAVFLRFSVSSDGGWMLGQIAYADVTGPRIPD